MLWIVGGVMWWSVLFFGETFLFYTLKKSYFFFIKKLHKFSQY